jgi:N-acetylglucosaminyldiphosphoundecaprenol N-acetyl-beta-D-mannosaminyltransferase
MGAVRTAEHPQLAGKILRGRDAAEKQVAIMERVRFLNAAYDPLTLKQTVDGVFRHVDVGPRGWLCTVNVAILMMMRSDRRLQNFVDKAAIAVADGQPIVWCAPWFGQALPERVTGVDLVDAICERAARAGKGIYLLGATAEIVGKLAQRLQERHPTLRLDFADGYFSNDDAEARADRVRAAGSDILFVGMGVPRQEIFIEEQWDRLGVGVAIGVGGSFDVLAGLRSRAPAWVQRLGMEWFYRLIQEPRRLFMRYLITNSQFLWLVIAGLFKGRRRT